MSRQAQPTTIAQASYARKRQRLRLYAGACFWRLDSAIRRFVSGWVRYYIHGPRKTGTTTSGNRCRCQCSCCRYYSW